MSVELEQTYRPVRCERPQNWQRDQMVSAGGQRTGPGIAKPLEESLDAIEASADIERMRRRVTDIRDGTQLPW